MAQKKITCKSFLDDLGDYVDGTVEAELRVSLEAHLAKCPDCWVLFDETQKTVEIVQEHDCHPMPDAVRDRLMTALNSHLGRK